ncbi:pilus assembly protein PilP [Candidatus Sororendozoicomonas aggregata]|uniref:pilus assembly protein PilP n=1 Tax=Candidatus Sororendozoicomonas aggregata TaxID=3073239 RepID=UPI002ED61DD6
MMAGIRRAFWCVLPLMTGCSVGHDMQDIEQFMAEVKARAPGKVEPVPEYASFPFFTYSASSLRSPFEPPRQSIEKERFDTSIKPDLFRVKGHLEQFDIATFTMVGHIANTAGHWGLIRSGTIIYRVQVGDYLGRNHGRITAIGDEEIKLTELMPVGPDAWVERHRRIPLMTSGDDQ